MAKTGADEVATKGITHGSGDVFADLGDADAEERQTKLRLAHALNQVLKRRGLTQTAAAEPLGINQPKVSVLVHYKLEGYSVERRMAFLAALDRDVEIVIRKKPRSRPAARIRSWRRDERDCRLDLVNQLVKVELLEPALARQRRQPLEPETEVALIERLPLLRIHLGRPRKLEPHQVNHARGLIAGGKTRGEVAGLLGVSQKTLWPAVRASKIDSRR